MPLFHWEALTAAGERTEGAQVGASEVQVIELLRRQGLRVTAVRRELPVAAVALARPVTAAVLRLLRELRALRSLGFSVPAALTRLAADPERERSGLAGELRLVRQAVEAGQPLGEALTRAPQRFDALVCRVLAAGEARGDLDGALRRLTAHLEQAQQPDPLIAALRGVGWTLLAGATALVLALGVLAPIAAGLLARLDLTPSRPGAGLMTLAARLLPLLRWLAVAAAGLGLGGLAALRIPRLRARLDALLLAAPGVGPALRLHGALRLSRLLALLLAVDLPLLAALELAAPRLGNQALAKGLLRARTYVAQGIDLAEGLADARLLPPLAIALVRGGEAAGDLGAALPVLAGLCEAEAAQLAGRARTLTRGLRLLVFAALGIGALLLLWPLGAGA